MSAWPVGFTLTEAAKKSSDKPVGISSGKNTATGISTSLDSIKKSIADKASKLAEFDKNNHR